ncbi:hypothetical protein JGU66_18350 [Myxococcaceae bacterium JPH2]|nr:hypothetical protein [Myxococcaceae bacterium JPH2]
MRFSVRWHSSPWAAVRTVRPRRAHGTRRRQRHQRHRSRSWTRCSKSRSWCASRLGLGPSSHRSRGPSGPLTC